MMEIQKESLEIFLKSIDFPLEYLPQLKAAISKSWQESRKTTLHSMSYDNAMEQFVNLLEDIEMNRS